jgi:hypothetical protein
MIQVGLLTEAEKDSLVGQLYDEDSYFTRYKMTLITG